MPQPDFPPPPPAPPGPGPFYTLTAAALDIAHRPDGDDQPLHRVPFHRQLAASYSSIEQLPAEITALRAAGELVEGTRKRPNPAFKRLPGLPNLRILSAWSVDQQRLETIGACTRLEVLHIQNVRAESLAPLGALRGLRHLVIDYAPRLISLAPLATLPELRTLRVEDARKIATLEPLAAMTGLRGLALVAGMFKKWPVASYQPLAPLAALTWLELDTVLPQDGSLRPLSALRALRHLLVSSGYFPLEEVARLRAAFPRLDAQALDPYWPCGGLRCDDCGTEQLRMSGIRGRVLCPACQADAVRRHVARFEALVSAGTARQSARDAVVTARAEVRRRRRAGDLIVRAIPSRALEPELSREIVALCDAAYRAPMAAYFAALGPGDHLLGLLDGMPVSHLMWITRSLQPQGGAPLRTAYVELVATDPLHERRGYATRLLTELVPHLRDYELAALSPATDAIYARLGWRDWRGPLFARQDGRLVATPGERVMILPLERTPPLDLDAPLSVEWREGEIW